MAQSACFKAENPLNFRGEFFGQKLLYFITFGHDMLFND